jgi:DNA polymerase-3 subunit alpha
MKIEKKFGDIDLDYAPKDREKVYNHMIEKFGDDYTDYILAIGTVSDKATIDEIGRALSRKFPNNKLFSLSSIADIKKEYEADAEKTKLKYPEIFYYFDGVLNTSISQSIHPAGMVVSPISLSDNYGETYRDGKKLLQIDMEGVHEVSLVKYDILGLKNVGIIKDACKYANISYPKSNKINWEDENVWKDMTISPYGIFQFESDFAFTLLKQFMPKNIFDMSLVTAALRPAGTSYRDELMERKIHKNPSTIIDNMLKDNLGFLIYQEDTIKFLKDICGLSGSEADNIRRAIGRKQKDRLDKAMPSILEGYCKKSNQPRNVAEQEAKEFLQIIEDSADYQFGYNHSIAYCMIGYVCAYLRYYYPLEFICSYLNNADTEKDIANGTDLAKTKKIKILPIKFGISRAKYSFDKKTNSIYKGIGSIKFLNEDVSEELFKLSKNKYTNFTDLLIDIKTKTSTNSRQLDILIKLDFFSDFGNSKELLNIVEVADVFKFGAAKTIKKDKIEGSYITSFIDKYATDKNTKGNELKNYTILDCRSLIVECEKYIKSLNIEDIDLRNKIINQQEYLGYISANGKEEDRPILFVQDVKTLRRKSDNKQFGYSVFTQSIGSGITSRFTVFNKTIKEHEKINKGDLIKCLDYSVERGYFTLKNFEKIL